MGPNYRGGRLEGTWETLWRDCIFFNGSISHLWNILVLYAPLGIHSACRRGDIDKLNTIQRSAAHFVANSYQRLTASSCLRSYKLKERTSGWQACTCTIQWINIYCQLSYRAIWSLLTNARSCIWLLLKFTLSCSCSSQFWPVPDGITCDILFFTREQINFLRRRRHNLITCLWLHMWL